MQDTESSRCPNCGASINSDSGNCTYCGSKLKSKTDKNEISTEEYIKGEVSKIPVRKSRIKPLIIALVIVFAIAGILSIMISYGLRKSESGESAGETGTGSANQEAGKEYESIPFNFPFAVGFSSQADGNFDIFVVKERTSVPVNITEGRTSDDIGLCFSYDSKKIACASGTEDLMTVCILNNDGNDFQKIKENQEDSEWPYSFSPDGKLVSFVVLKNNKTGIYSFNLENEKITKLFSSKESENCPAFSPDGSTLLFNSNKDGDFELFLLDLKSSKAFQLTDNDADDISPCFSPDGERIIYSSNIDGDYEIYSIDFDGKDSIQLTDSSYDETMPAVSPDGGYIAFVSDKNDSFNSIYIMKADGSDIKKLTDRNYEETNPFFGR